MKGKTSCKVAAKSVGIAKKTLDDYLYQIKLAKKFDFNFIKEKNKKIGVLRNFVRKMKKLNKEKKHSISQSQIYFLLIFHKYLNYKGVEEENSEKENSKYRENILKENIYRFLDI